MLPTIQKLFLAAIDRGEAREIRELIVRGADANFRGQDPDGQTPLIRAVVGGHLGAVEALIDAGADIDCPATVGGWTPLMHALGRPEFMHLLLSAGADLNARTSIQEMLSPGRRKANRRGGETALHLAAATNNVEAVRLLIKAGAEIEALDANGIAPLDAAIKLGSATEAALALVECGAELTPERLEAMHSGAHEVHSDLQFFPNADFITSLKKPGERSGTARTQDELPGSSVGDTKCPHCGELTYSHKARLCGSCGARLTPSVGLGTDQGECMNEQRKWARDLADSLGNTGVSKAVQTPTAHPVGETAVSRSIRRARCVEEFRRRDRPDFWLHMVGYIMLLSISVYAANAIGALSASPCVVLAVLFIFACWHAWRRAAPSCPNCRENIRTCSPLYCCDCGVDLRHGRRCHCGENPRPSGFLSFYSRTGYSRAVRFCPNCGSCLSGAA